MAVIQVRSISPTLADQLGPASKRPHKSFGASLAAARLNRSFTDGRLASEIGVPRDVLRDWEHGYKLPSAGQLRALVRVLGLRWEGKTVVNDPILPPVEPIVRLVPMSPPAGFRACAFNPAHHFMTKDVPTALHCSPACASAAVRQEMRRRATERRGGR